MPKDRGFTAVSDKFFKRFNEADIVGNVIHEYCHNIGFGHNVKNNPTRQYTVPYAIGYIAAKIAKRIADL